MRFKIPIVLATVLALAPMLHPQPARGASCTDALVWTAPGPTSPPAGRWDAGSAWDPVNARFLVFGGADATTLYNDVWAYTPATNAWTQLSPSGTPPAARRNHTVVYDSARQRLLVFGGRSSGTQYNDVWALSLSGTPTWSQLTTSGGPPSARYGHAAVYDAGGDRMVIFGATPFTNDPTWYLTLSTLQWTQVGSGAAPVAQEGCAAVYDPVNRRMIVCGGRGYCSCICPTPSVVDVNQLYALPLNPVGTWQQLLPYAYNYPRAYAAAIYDPQCQRMILYGGVNDVDCITGCYPFGFGEYPLSDVQSLSLAGTPSWSTTTVTGTPPAARGHHVAAFDPAGNQLYAFGGGGRAPSGGSCPTTYLNSLAALGLPDITPPSAVTDLTSLGGCTLVQLQWTDTGDDGTSGRAAQYELRYSTSAITDGNYTACAILATGAPGPAGTQEILYHTVGECSPYYYYAVKIKDSSGNWSAISDLPSGTKTACPRPPLQCLDEFNGQPVGTVPVALGFSAAAPNPTHSATRLTLSLPGSHSGDPYEVAAFDVSGRRVRVLQAGVAQPGDESIIWDLRDDSGRGVGAGVYFLRAQVGREALTRAVIVSR